MKGILLRRALPPSLCRKTAPTGIFKQALKNKHLLVVYSTPTRGFTAAVSVFMGTPPAKPLICKSVLIRSGARIRQRWAHPTGGKPLPSCANFDFVLRDIIKTSFFYVSLPVHLSLPPFTISFREIKNPAYTG